LQNASDSQWEGAEIRTQESAQKALVSINEAISSKDKVRATLGAFQNRLENTITNLEIQAENLQASESRISDSDVAREVIELTKSSVLVQAAMGMVAQANSLNSLALGLIGR
jgi:flagellin